MQLEEDKTQDEDGLQHTEAVKPWERESDVSFGWRCVKRSRIHTRAESCHHTRAWSGAGLLGRANGTAVSIRIERDQGARLHTLERSRREWFLVADRRGSANSSVPMQDLGRRSKVPVCGRERGEVQASARQTEASSLK